MVTHPQRGFAMTTGRLDFGDLVENVGVGGLSDIVIGAGYIGAAIATLPQAERKVVASLLVKALATDDEQLSCMSKFVIEVVANSIDNKEFASWALHEVGNMVN
jgi:hypothetical protein